MQIDSEPTVKIDCKQGLVKAVRFNADGQYALTCGSDRTVKLWRPSKLLQLKSYKGHSAPVIDCQANHDSSQFLSCSNDRSVIVWDVETGKILRRFRELVPLNSSCFGRMADTALTCSVDGVLRIYDLKAVNAWEPIQTLGEASDSVTCCRVHEHLIFSVSVDKIIRTYDIRKGSLSIDTMHIPLNHIALSQDANSMLVTCLRGPPVLIDRTSGTIMNQFKGNDRKLFKLESTFVMNDTSLASGSEDGKVYVWNTSSEKPTKALKHPKTGPSTIIQTISSDTLDNLLTASGNFMFMWSL